MMIESFEQFAALVEHTSHVDIVVVPTGYDDDRESLANGLIGQVVARTTGNEAKDMVRRLVSLPAVETLRCHLPGFGLRVGLHDGRLIGIAMCFECNNARIFDGPDLGWLTFDGSSPQAIQMLEAFRSAAAAWATASTHADPE